MMIEAITRRSRITLSLALVLAASIAARAASATDAGDEVRKVEERRVQALTSHDYATLEKLLDDDLTYTHANGRLDTKAQFLQSLRSGSLEYQSIQQSDVEVRTYGDTAVMTGRSHLKVLAKGRPLDLPIRFTLVYVKLNGDWQLVAYQSAPLQKP